MSPSFLFVCEFWPPVIHDLKRSREFYEITKGPGQSNSTDREQERFIGESLSEIIKCLTLIDESRPRIKKATNKAPNTDRLRWLKNMNLWVRRCLHLNERI